MSSINKTQTTEKRKVNNDFPFDWRTHYSGSALPKLEYINLIECSLIQERKQEKRKQETKHSKMQLPGYDS